MKPGGSCGVDSWCLDGDVTPLETIINDNQNFTREVFLSDSPSPGPSKCNDTLGFGQAKQVEVVVTWNDAGGGHEINVVSWINRV